MVLKVLYIVEKWFIVEKGFFVFLREFIKVWLEYFRIW